MSAGTMNQVGADTMRALMTSEHIASGQSAIVGPSTPRMSVSTAYAPTQVRSATL